MLYYLNNEPCALISNIQHYSIHDGPGIRTSVFFSGCTMRCIWCSNPEAIEPRQRLGVYPDKCLSQQRCRECLSACPVGGAPIVFGEDGSLKTLDMIADCEDCLRCAEACPPRAIKLWGRKMRLPDLMSEVESNQDFYRRSGGGITLTGGEVMLQWEFADILLAACKASSIHTCIETALHCPVEHMETVYRNTDLVIADIKHMDSAAHRRITGAGNELILSNIVRTAELGKPLVIRTPVVPGCNDDEDNIGKTARFIRDKLGGKVIMYQLLPFRILGTEKYASLMMEYPMSGYALPELGERESHLKFLAEFVRREFGINAAVDADKHIRQDNGGSV